MQIVRFKTNDDGDEIINDHWHWIDEGNVQGRATFCTVEFFGEGESTLEFEASQGRITCPNCIAKLKIYKKAARQARV